MSKPSEQQITKRANRRLVGTGAAIRCSICACSHRAEADSRLLAREASGSVADWLRSEGVIVSSAALRRHRENHLGKADESAKAIIRGRAAPIIEAAKRIVDDADTLAEISELGLTVARALKPKMTNPDAHRTLADVTLFNGALREAREAANARHEMLNGKQVNVDAHVSGGLAALFAQLETERK